MLFSEERQIHTTREIAQQPRMWKETFLLFKEKQNELEEFFNEIISKHDQLRVIFTGAGTSAYIGNILLPHFRNNDRVIIDSIATTKIVSNPYNYLTNQATLLVSFARSGDSPESIATTELAEQCIESVYHLVISCNEVGSLAKNSVGKCNRFVFLLPPETNDKGFAMTSSFTSMMLAGLLIFEWLLNKHKISSDFMNQYCTMADEFLRKNEETIKKIAKSDFKRVVNLGSGVFEGLAQEASLKILELTGGLIQVCSNSPLGFRHGPKSFLDHDTITFVYISSHPYTRMYDVDILKEIYREEKRKEIIAIVSGEVSKEITVHCDHCFIIPNLDTADVYLSLLYILTAQTLAVYKSSFLGLNPDNPFADGRVNRVVQGVTIYPYIDEI